MIMGFWHENYCTQRTKTKSFAHHTIPILHIMYLKAPNRIIFNMTGFYKTINQSDLKMIYISYPKMSMYSFFIPLKDYRIEDTNISRNNIG